MKTKAFYAAEHINASFNPLRVPLVSAIDADTSKPGRVKFTIQNSKYTGKPGYTKLREALERVHGEPHMFGSDGEDEGAREVGWFTDTSEVKLSWDTKSITLTVVEPDLRTVVSVKEKRKRVQKAPTHGADIEAATEYVNDTTHALAGPLVRVEDATIIGPGRIRFKIRPELYAGRRGYAKLFACVKRAEGQPTEGAGDSEGNESAGWKRANDRELWVERENKEISVLLVDRVIARAARPLRTKKVEESADLKMIRMLCESVRLTLGTAKKFAASLNESDKKAAHDLLNEITDELLKGIS